jgi:hypothetical protein
VGFLLGTIGSVIGGVVLFFSLIWLATGVGFLHGKAWSWTLGMVFSILSLLGAFAALIVGLITGGVGGLLFWGLMLYYLTRTHVKAFFGRSGPLLSPAYASPYAQGPRVNQVQNAATNAGYGRPSVGPPVTFPPVSQGSSTSIPTPNPGPSNSISPSSSNSSRAPVCPYCHTTLPMGTRKCLTCGAAL